MSVKCQMSNVKCCNQGFSLVELVVAIAIFFILTSVVMVSQHRFGGNILITNLAYDVALGIRQAQVYGVSVKATSAGSFQKSYGVHFEQTGSYILFVDLDGSDSYNTSSSDANGCRPSSECLTMWRIEQGNSITQFCGDATCYGAGRVPSMDVIFHRPDPEPVIKVFKADGIIDTFSTASITVTSPQAVSKTVNVSASGQISIK